MFTSLTECFWVPLSANGRYIINIVFAHFIFGFIFPLSDILTFSFSLWYKWRTHNLWCACTYSYKLNLRSTAIVSCFGDKGTLQRHDWESVLLETILNSYDRYNFQSVGIRFNLKMYTCSTFLSRICAWERFETLCSSPSVSICSECELCKLDYALRPYWYRALAYIRHSPFSPEITDGS